MKSALALVLLLTILVCAPASVTTAVSVHVKRDARTRIVLPFKVEDSAKRLFRHARWAIQIDSIVCDGRKIEGKRKTPMFSDLKNAGFQPTSDLVLYSLGLGEFLLADHFDPEFREYSFLEFDIPLSFDLMEVKFRVRYEDGSLSDQISVKSYDYDHFGAE